MEQQHPAPRSQAQIEASRRNGALSRGPATPEGRAAVRFNALKHGVAAHTLLLPGESAEAFENLLAGLVETHQPATSGQLACLHRIAAAEWRYARSLGQESLNLELAMAETNDQAEQKIADLTQASLASFAERHLLDSGSSLEFMRRQQARLRREIDANYRLLHLLTTTYSAKPPRKITERTQASEGQQDLRA